VRENTVLKLNSHKIDKVLQFRRNLFNVNENLTGTNNSPIGIIRVLAT